MNNGAVIRDFLFGFEERHFVDIMFFGCNKNSTPFPIPIHGKPLMTACHKIYHIRKRKYIIGAPCSL